ncbi:S1 family peptidase [Archangium lansingense]|uniref:S1 family peptidase n=1 Tax=Archangium lansingense TaxID=2995310 RepID=A0ABT4A588_9BACT|nr:S1 family peptidase [Archangium lansinium]MCY1076429.1 S1 family peptidase [Archangium lansinium]
MKASIAARTPMFLAAMLVGSAAVAQDDKPTAQTTPPSNVVVVPHEPSPTGQGMPSGYASAEQLMKAQLPLTDAAKQLDAVIRQTPDTGFGEIVLDVPKGLVKLWWKEGQEIPAGVVALVDRLSAQNDVDVVVETVPYSKDELRAEAKRLFLQASETPGLTIARIEPLADYQGLKVEVENSAEEVAQMSLFKSAPVHIKVNSGKRPAQLSRWDDSSPWYGGAAARSAFGNGCSTGFGVWYDGWFSDDYYMLTAAHCSYYQNGISFTDGNNDAMGTIPGSGTNGPETRISEYDTIAIKVTNAGSRIFDGGVYVGEFTKPVHGATDPWVGEYLCTSGAYSGVSCGIVTRTKDFFYYSYDTRLHGPLVMAEQVDYLAAAGEGDSGGPVFSLSPNEGVIAKGTISAGDTANKLASCTGIISTNGQNRLCSWEVVFTPIWTSLIVHDLEIRSQ